MDNTIYKNSYISQIEQLSTIIDSLNKRILDDNPDLLICNNSNFFSKSFLTTMCAYLESYLKDVLMIIVVETNTKLNSVKLPHNLIQWSLNMNKNLKEIDYKYENLNLTIEKKILDDYISGNPFKTVDLFKKFGINLQANQIFKTQKEQINSIVAKRNKILHHNDEASDVSFDDLQKNIILLKSYISNIDKVICEHLA